MARGKRKSNEEYKRMLEEKFPNAIFPEIKTMYEKLEYSCKFHNMKYKELPFELLRPRRKECCPLCRKDNFLQEKLKNVPDYINYIDVIYTGKKKHYVLKIKCDVCGGTYNKNLDAFCDKTVKSHPCPLCLQWTKERLIKEGRERY